MKYFCKIKLSKAKINELVYADGPKDAEAIARANIAILLEDWSETFLSAQVISFYELGEMACNFHKDISYGNGDYYYLGRKINDDMNFINGFAHAHQVQKAAVQLDEDITYRAIGGNPVTEI